jgi:uncharacterized protein YprB with RNaseH-like and TPR domain
LQGTLGGDWQVGPAGRTYVVERTIPPDARHGRVVVGELAEQCRRAIGCAAMLSTGARPGPPLIFFDLETTGLSGGAGTLAFLAGCAWFADDGAFIIRQHLLADFADERAMLGCIGRDLTAGGSLVSFNGKSFDSTVLETRHLFHRLEWPGARQPHVDILHSARRFWRDAGATSSCSLGSLEEELIGHRRVRDVSGYEVPARYFQFVRSGDPRPLVAVLEHNRQDLLSLVALTARVLRLLLDGPAAARDAREALGLGRVYARAGLEVQAGEAYQRAVTLLGEDLNKNLSAASLRVTALRELACALRRARRHEEAASRWRELLDVPGCPAHMAREASEALAIHHEHRARDLAKARDFALRSLGGDARPAWKGAVEHRLARIQRKMDRSDRSGFLAYY